jgi:membrane protease YdiL (CAAX protease family)
MKTTGIMVYLAISFGVAWGIWAILWIGRVSATDTTFQWLSLPAIFAPALGGFVVRRWITREGFADVGQQLNWKNCWRYYLFAWLSPLFITAVIVILAMVLGVSQPDFSLQRFLRSYAPSAQMPPLPDRAFLLAIPVTLLQAWPVALLNWGEEFGWRGYLQPTFRR